MNSNASYSCDNCGQSVLETDDTCWHCGRRLSKKTTETADQARAAGASTTTSLSLTTVGSYAAVTALVFLALLLLTWSLGERPLNLNGLPRSGWQTTTDEDLSYALDLPQEWEWLDKSDGRQRIIFDTTLAANPQFQAIIAPIGQREATLELVAIATDTSTNGQVASSFLLVARDNGGKRLSAEQVVAYLQRSGNGIQVLEAKLVNDSTGRQGAELSIQVKSGAQELHCLQRFVAGSSASYLVAACSERSSVLANDLPTMISSFRTLLD